MKKKNFFNNQQNKQTKISFTNEIYSIYYKNLINEDNIYEIVEKFPEIKSFNELLSKNTCLYRLYIMTIENINCQLYQNAIFFADKLLTLTNAHPLIVFLLGECYFHNNDFKKVHSLFVKFKLLNYNQNFQILAARSLVNIHNIKKKKK